MRHTVLLLVLLMGLVALSCQVANPPTNSLPLSERATNGLGSDHVIPLDLLEKVEGFFDRALNRVLWTIGAILVIASVSVGVMLWRLDKRRSEEFKSDKNELMTRIGAAEEQFTQQVEELRSEGQKIDQSLEDVRKRSHDIEEELKKDISERSAFSLGMVHHTFAVTCGVLLKNEGSSIVHTLLAAEHYVQADRKSLAESSCLYALGGKWEEKASQIRSHEDIPKIMARIAGELAKRGWSDDFADKMKSLRSKVVKVFGEEKVGGEEK